jgi:hypothetical protein
MRTILGINVVVFIERLISLALEGVSLLFT